MKPGPRVSQLGFVVPGVRRDNTSVVSLVGVIAGGKAPAEQDARADELSASGASYAGELPQAVVAVAAFGRMTGTAEEQAAAMVAAVRDDPTRRLELAARFYDRRIGRVSIRA